MAQNLSKKFALLSCCLMTMQALRLVISTAGFCVVRFHIDCELFNIFISRLVNAVLMSQLFGNWLGDLIVFAASGPMKMISIALANWAEFLCFCSALFCLVDTEEGHLTGFYWSMVLAYFWWKVGEAPATSIAVDEADYYFAGFTLSGVWAAMLKAVVMLWCVEEKGIHSEPLGDVNISVVGARSVKTTVDYRAAKSLFAVTIVLTALMCFAWESAQGVREIGRARVWSEIVKAVSQVQTALTKVEVKVASADAKQLTGASVAKSDVRAHESDPTKITITVRGLTALTQAGTVDEGADGTDKIKNALQEAITVGTIKGVQGTVAGTNTLTITITAAKDGWIVGDHVNEVAARTAVVLAGIMAIPGALLFASFAKLCKKTIKATTLRRWAISGGVFGALLTACTFGSLAAQEDGEKWVPSFKWPKVDQSPAEGKGIIAPVGGLVAGMLTGAAVGLWIGACKGSKKRGTAGGALVGSAVGLWTGEIYNGVVTWNKDVEEDKKKGAKGKADNVEGKVAAVCCGFLINVLGLGTVYSIYPGMAPCSITQFQYFNIIDILILILSSIGPIVIMVFDLADVPWKLGYAIGGSSVGKEEDSWARWLWVGGGVLLLIVTNICEIIVLDIMQHPFAKLAKDVTTSGWRAVTLTVTMVTSQLVSTGVGFAATAAGSGFNDGIINMNSTAVLWTTECCGVLGEGYLTELKKYEPGKWPTQGMDGWDSYKWWNRKAFGNAWQIWCCIGTTDLRRDIMLCRQ